MATKSEKKEIKKRNENGIARPARVPVAKTYKLFIGGQFPRTESGRYITVKDTNGAICNVCRASRKDLRNAVVAARSISKGWASKTAYNRSQILYRMSEMLEGRKEQFVSDLMQRGSNREMALSEVERSIDCIVHYAGWCDKYIQVFSSVNPVASAHFNFSIPEPVGVVGILDDVKGGLYSLVSLLLPVLSGANTAVVLVAPESAKLALDFAEVIQTSDLPAGVVNILTGNTDELLKDFGTHLDINAVVFAQSDLKLKAELERLAATHILRVITCEPGSDISGPYAIMDCQEVKTTWHPIGK